MKLKSAKSDKKKTKEKTIHTKKEMGQTQTTANTSNIQEDKDIEGKKEKILKKGKKSPILKKSPVKKNMSPLKKKKSLSQKKKETPPKDNQKTSVEKETDREIIDEGYWSRCT